MKKIATNTPPAARGARSWTPPRLVRLEAGRAELALGPFSDGPNNS